MKNLFYFNEFMFNEDIMYNMIKDDDLLNEEILINTIQVLSKSSYINELVKSIQIRNRLREAIRNEKDSNKKAILRNQNKDQLKKEKRIRAAMRKERLRMENRKKLSEYPPQKVEKARKQADRIRRKIELLNKDE